jgi:hypothetical protein
MIFAPPTARWFETRKGNRNIRHEQIGKVKQNRSNLVTIGLDLARGNGRLIAIYCEAIINHSRKPRFGVNSPTL